MPEESLFHIPPLAGVDTRELIEEILSRTDAALVVRVVHEGANRERILVAWEGGRAAALGMLDIAHAAILKAAS